MVSKPPLQAVRRISLLQSWLCSPSGITLSSASVCFNMVTWCQLKEKAQHQEEKRKITVAMDTQDGSRSCLANRSDHLTERWCSGDLWVCVCVCVCVCARACLHKATKTFDFTHIQHPHLYDKTPSFSSNVWLRMHVNVMLVLRLHLSIINSKDMWWSIK